MVRLRALILFTIRGRWKHQMAELRYRRRSWFRIVCEIHLRDGLEWAEYIGRVGGYHNSEFRAALEDIQCLLTRLRAVEGMRTCRRWLTESRRYLQGNIL